jgi:hypothetical protein
MVSDKCCFCDETIDPLNLQAQDKDGNHAHYDCAKMRAEKEIADKTFYQDLLIRVNKTLDNPKKKIKPYRNF